MLCPCSNKILRFMPFSYFTWCKISVIFLKKRKDSQVNLNPLFPAPTELQTLVLKPVTSPSLDMTQSQPGKLLYSYDCSKSLYVQI